MNHLFAKKLILTGAIVICPLLFAACGSEPTPAESEAVLEQQMQQVEAEERAHFNATQSEQ